MKPIEVARYRSVTEREQWRFRYDDRRHALVLESYVKLSRPDTKHAMQTEQDWAGMDAAQAPLPKDVRTEALVAFTNTLRVLTEAV